MEIGRIIDSVLSQMVANFDFGYMLTINVLTYFVIKVIDESNGNRKVTVWQKRIVLLVGIAIVAIVYKLAGYCDDIVLINSSILAPVFWSWILRPILVRLGVGYKDITNEKANDNGKRRRKEGRP